MISLLYKPTWVIDLSFQYFFRLSLGLRHLLLSPIILTKEFTASIAWRSPLLLFQVWLQQLYQMSISPCTGRDSSQSLLFILSMILYTSIMYPLVVGFFLCQTEESQPTQLLLIGCSLVLLLAFSNSVYPEMRYQILLGFKWDLNHPGSLDLFENPFPSPRIGTWFSAQNMDIVTPKHMLKC